MFEKFDNVGIQRVVRGKQTKIFCQSQLTNANLFALLFIRLSQFDWKTSVVMIAVVN